MKSRFCILDKSGGMLQYSSERTCKIFIAVVIVHNLAVSYRWPEVEEVEVPNNKEAAECPNPEIDGVAANVRRQLIHMCFT